MKRYMVHVVTAAGLLFFVACSDNPVADEHDGDEGLTVAAFNISDDHVSTLEEITFTARVVDHDGEVATDVEAVRVEFRLADAEDWRGAEMTKEGSDYVGTSTFTTSGAYEVRVVGSSHGSAELEAIYEMEGLLEVERAHQEAGGYRVEYENFPGHVHEGETVMVAFWVFEIEGDDHGGHGHGMHGLEAEIHCGDPSGTNEMHKAEEPEDGKYTAMHTFGADGEAHMGFKFQVDGQEFEVDFHIHVSGTH